MQTVPLLIRIFLPPVWLLIFLIGEGMLNLWLPGPQLFETPWNYFGIFPILIGIGLAIWAHQLFRNAGTDVVPFRNISAFVVAGPYHFTRNPMYLGMTLVLLGAAIQLGVMTPFLIIPIFMAVITTLFIRREENLMETKFGAVYLDYKHRIRRWL